MHTLALKLAAASLLCVAALAQATQYEVTDLGALPSKKHRGDSHAQSINADGVAVGTASTAIGGIQRPALFVDGQAIDLMKRAGVQNAIGGVAHGINQAQQVTGHFYDSAGEQTAFVEDHGAVQVLALPGGGSGMAINQAGDVVAYGYACHCAYLVHAGVATPLPVPHPERTLWHVANALNDQGWAAGGVTETSPNGERRFAALWHQGRAKLLPFGPTLRSAMAWGLNAQNDVVGEADTLSGDTHAFLFRDKVMAELPGDHGDYSRANAINLQGQIVGIRYFSSFGEGFVTVDGRMASLTDLVAQPPGSKWSVIEALGINGAGEIVADAMNLTLNLEHRAVLLRPLP